jgi:hypothetical protein
MITETDTDPYVRVRTHASNQINSATTSAGHASHAFRPSAISNDPIYFESKS